MPPAAYDTLILSDLHLGSEVSRAEDATRMLRESTFRRLILLGDIFSDLNFGRLTKEHWKFLSYIRKLSNPKRGLEVVWVEGNHDQGLTSVMSHLVGVKVYQEFAWEFAGLKHIAVHGHQFDGFAINNIVLSNIGTHFHLLVQKLDFTNKRLSRYVDTLNTRWLRLSAKVSSGALAHARAKHAQRIFCGHTHVPISREEAGVEYYNSGCWTDSKPTYITIDAEGVRIREYEHRSHDRDPGEERSEADWEFADLAGESGLSEDHEYESISS
jgi:UDP-2,3-diacylglucosamine pyrophosphatase LpxH